MKHRSTAIRVVRVSNWLLLGLHPYLGARRRGKINSKFKKDSFPELENNQQVPFTWLRRLWGVWTQTEEGQTQGTRT